VKGFFQNIWSQIKELWQAIESTFDEVVTVIESILDLKTIVTEELNTFITTAREALKDTSDFAERVKTLKQRLVRADVAFQIFDDIRTGALKNFIETQIGDLQTEVGNQFSEVSAVIQGIGAAKPRGTGLLTKIVDAVKAIEKGWKVVAFIVHALTGLTPVLQAFQAKLSEYEGIILPQDSPRRFLTETYSKRVR